MSKKKITVIMPVYNNIFYIKKGINSVIKQNFKSWEMIISDDGSTDGTKDFLNQIKNKKIKIFFQKKNLGIFGNLKFLNNKAKSSIVKILCADDCLFQNSLADIYLFFKKFKSCKLVTCLDQDYKKNVNNEV